MQKIALIMHPVWISVFIISLSGCASTNSKTKIFGQTMLTIDQVYQKKLQHNPNLGRQQAQRAIRNKGGDLRGNLHNTYAELRQQFPLLPNPVLMLYIYPHLTGAGTPVPGYYTVLPFYTQDQYALPGETTVPLTLPPTPKADR